MKYFVRIGQETTEVSVDGDSVTVGAEPLRAHADQVDGTPLTLITVGDEVHRVFARTGERKGEYVLVIDGYRVIVEAIDERTKVIRDMSGTASRPSGPANLRAPMPGLIVRIAVKEGDAVRPGQGLVVMEAMKMENELRATAAGVVRRVLVSPGSAVEKGAMLLEMEG